MHKGFSAAEQQLYQNGAFVGQIDPFAEAARYFHPLHEEFISTILQQIQVPLLSKGYVAGRETSLQIAEGREPDIYVLRADFPDQRGLRWDYETAAAEVLAEVGVPVTADDALSAIHIRDAATGTLVTVLELVSPGNKTRDHEILAYRERRSRLLLEQGVNVVEVDATRSLKRLTANTVTQTVPYHVAIYLPGAGIRIIETDFGQALKRIALPLRADVVALELHIAYTRAYAQTVIAWHIQHEGGYSAATLPFPTTLNDEQIQGIMHKIEAWQSELKRLAEA
jgi:Protein of unknown function (DUF4058)